ALEPNYATAYNNRGRALQTLGLLGEALASYDKAIQLRPNLAEIYDRRAYVLLMLKRHEEALADYEKAFELEPDAPFALGPRLNAKFLACYWQGWKGETARLREMLEDGRKASPPFLVFGLLDSRRHQLIAARAWAADRCSANNALPPFSKVAARPARLRIGYF